MISTGPRLLLTLALALAPACSDRAADPASPSTLGPSRHQSTVEQSNQRQDRSRHRTPADDLSTLEERYQDAAPPADPDDREDNGTTTLLPTRPTGGGLGHHVAMLLVALGWAFAAVMFLGALTRRVGNRLETARAT